MHALANKIHIKHMHIATVLWISIINWKGVALNTSLYVPRIGLGLQYLPKLYRMYRKSPSPDVVHSAKP